MNKFVLFFIFNLSVLNAWPLDSIKVHHSHSLSQTLKSTEEKKHSPHKASIYSAVLPGLGQAYNRKYWKIPIVYAGLGVTGYFLLDNRQRVRELQQALNVIYDNDPTTMPESKYSKVDPEVLQAQRNIARTNRDYSIIAFSGVYLINIVDAAIDAHFYQFNIDKPLALQRKKNWNLHSSSQFNQHQIGLSIRF
jgi:hypothetical protein